MEANAERGILLLAAIIAIPIIVTWPYGLLEGVLAMVGFGLVCGGLIAYLRNRTARS